MKKTTRDTIKKSIRLILINVAILIGSMMVLYLVSIALFASIFNVIFDDPDHTMQAVNVLIRICLPIATGLAICIPHARSAEARRAFLNTLGAEKYNRKEDFKQLMKTKDFLIECIVFAALYIVMFFIANPPRWIFLLATIVFPFGTLWNDATILFMANPPQWIFLAAILVFPFVNLWHHTALHKQWASERIRFSNASASIGG